MPQPPEPELRQCSHNLPAAFANSVISRTLQQKLHSPQAFPGIASMNSSRVPPDSIILTLLPGRRSRKRNRNELLFFFRALFLIPNDPPCGDEVFRVTVTVPR